MTKYVITPKDATKTDISSISLIDSALAGINEAKNTKGADTFFSIEGMTKQQAHATAALLIMSFADAIEAQEIDTKINQTRLKERAYTAVQARSYNAQSGTLNIGIQGRNKIIFPTYGEGNLMLSFPNMGGNFPAFLMEQKLKELKEKLQSAQQLTDGSHVVIADTDLSAKILAQTISDLAQANGKSVKAAKCAEIVEAKNTGLFSITIPSETYEALGFTTQRFVSP